MLEELKEKITRLISLYEGEKQRADLLQRKLDETSAQLETSSKQIIEITRRIDNFKLAGAFSAEGTSNQAAKERIEGLIREIDRCIALMEK